MASKRCTTHRLEISPYLYELHEKMEEEKRKETATVATPTAKKLRPTSLKRGMMIRHVQLGEGKNHENCGWHDACEICGWS